MLGASFIAKRLLKRMTLDQFVASLAAASPPAAPAPLAALWLEAKGDWDGAHRLVAAAESRDAAWVHAFLHRREGDAGNALYWYRQARRAPCDAPFEAEWAEIAAALLAADGAAR
jgi:hypothetical protein